jgi:carbonic anhydrase/acetyltransferase-like protein (isoleucine patch superfamily)
MDHTGRGRRRSTTYHLAGERLEDRRLLSAGGMVSSLEVAPLAQPARHPNTPVMPFSTPSKKASFLDPSVSIKNGNSVVISFQSYVAPYATLDGRGHAAIKIGDGSNVLDSAQLIANPGHAYVAPQLLVGNNVSIGPGAMVLGPSVIGSYSETAAPTGIGARAVIDDATIQPGAIVSPLARVGPGVTVPSGYRVLPGVDVTNDAEASNPKLGKVVPVTSSDLSALRLTLTDAVGLAAGYTSLYQGSSATGVSPGANPAIGGIYNGYLPNVLGTSPSPGPSYVGGTKKAAPEFQTPHQGLVGSLLYNFPGRVIGPVVFTGQRAKPLLHHLGRANSIRADVGQPITIGSIAHTGRNVTITAPSGGTLTVGSGFRADADAVILGGSGVNAKIGDGVSVGSGAVVDRTSLGSDSTVGAGAYLLNSTFPAHTVIPAGAIYVNNKLQGFVASSGR